MMWKEILIFLIGMKVGHIRAGQRQYRLIPIDIAMISWVLPSLFCKFWQFSTNEE
jgi:hypothetical protein